ncbi:flagellar assembly peptidoglycan hydrolase FlgJ [Aquabacterium sp.]|uniref:flagellar assembly peptidoglycan hydrolase FlgJ n=1 Tax=Aquabacterium sp. TaxID=1872578 RepID=UPI002E31F963|nr:flagellar assembly peptidoglycan hydrolase FlgJ [Aquabacterium sp.]HEX5310638.1 flagellar assembly peptidoglycan hydrolase FlgJ [Aquabacterium sp.]
MGLSQTGNTNLSMDLRSLDRLKSASGADAKSGIKEAAKQLEGLFMQELMKSMRASTMNSGMLDNEATEMGTSMLDTQFANQMAGIPGGLADKIAKQLERQMGIKPEVDTSSFDRAVALPTLRTPPSSSVQSTQSGNNDIGNTRALSASERFVLKHQTAAKAAEAATGIPASNILGQAGLESGWGKHEIKMPDGSSSHNLFGIKAGAGWKGKVAEVTTTEYFNGVAKKVTAKFRAYDSYAEAFTDHARLLSQSPRYSQTVASADSVKDYAKGLQKAGYATDPAYADKLTKAINTTLRVQRSVS